MHHRYINGLSVCHGHQHGDRSDHLFHGDEVLWQAVVLRAETNQEI